MYTVCLKPSPPRSHRRYHFSPLIPLCKPPQPFAVGRYTLPLNSFSTLLSETKLYSRKCLLPWLKLLRALLPFFFNSLFFLRGWRIFLMFRKTCKPTTLSRQFPVYFVLLSYIYRVESPKSSCPFYYHPFPRHQPPANAQPLRCVSVLFTSTLT